jgi:hypothetical protein
MSSLEQKTTINWARVYSRGEGRVGETRVLKMNNPVFEMAKAPGGQGVVLRKRQFCGFPSRGHAMLAASLFPNRFVKPMAYAVFSPVHQNHLFASDRRRPRPRWCCAQERRLCARRGRVFFRRPGKIYRVPSIVFF